jgi:type 1 glutamine amidotransferase
MRSFRLLSLFACGFGFAGFLGSTATAQTPPAPKPPQTWEEKKAERFKPMTDEQKAAILAAIPASPAASPKAPRNILVFWLCEGFIHTSIPHGNFAIEEMGRKTGAYTATLADDYAVFDAANLARYDLVLFNNTTRLKFPDAAHRKALLDFLAAGKGVAGIHAASDNFDNWPEALAMMGGIFNGHPWNAGGTWAFRLDDAAHPVNRAFGGAGFWHKDEIYQYKPETYEGKGKLRVLVSLDMAQSRNIAVLLQARKDKAPEAADAEEAARREVPVSWIREFGGGRVFYSNFGHNESTYASAPMLQHYLDGIQYALGDLSADATPTASAADLKISLSPAEPAAP